jgi:ABC-2 type transport system ATP-binding protein
MHRPRLLILDEPTAGVDIELRLELWHYVQQINAEGTTILLTTHYLDEAAELSSRGAIVAGGTLAALGAIDELGGAEARVPIVRWREKGLLREERTENPGALVARLAAHGEPEALEVVRPSLEDIYLSYVGTEVAA